MVAAMHSCLPDLSCSATNRIRGLHAFRAADVRCCRLHNAARRRARRVAATMDTADTRQLSVVITGGTKGLGFCMAHEFLAAGDNVIICGRDQGRLDAALAALRQRHPQGKLQGMACDVSKAGDVDRLADFVSTATNDGVVDRWLNNAGQVTANTLLSDVSVDQIEQVVGVNVLGTLLCCRAALQLMRKQPPKTVPSYHIFNMGFSSWGASFSRSAVTHKATKTALTQLSKSLAEELTAAGKTSVGVHNLSPGMVLTGLLLEGASPTARRFFNTLAEEPEVVAEHLVPRIRAVQGTGSSIDFLSPAAAVARVVGGLPQILGGGRFFDKEGKRVSQPGASYTSDGVRLLYDYPTERY